MISLVGPAIADCVVGSFVQGSSVADDGEGGLDPTILSEEPNGKYTNA